MKLLTAAALALLLTTTANATIIDFDNLPGGGTIANNEVMTNQYASIGVNLSGTLTGTPVDTVALSQFGDTISGNYWINVPNGGNTFPRADIMTITFDNPVKDVSLQANTRVGDPATKITFRAYDNTSQLLETVLFGQASSWGSAVFTATNISSIEITQAYANHTYGIDNLSFVVPEPSTFILSAIGLLGIGYRRRKRA